MKICLFGDARSVHLHQLARELLRRGHFVHVLSHKTGEIPGVVVDRFRVPPPSLTNPRRWPSRWTHYLRGFLRQFDVINIHFLADWGFTPELLEEGCVVATAWGSDVVAPPGEDGPSPSLIDARVTLLRHARAVTACGPTFAATVAAFAGLERGAVNVVPFGVDLDLFHGNAKGQNLRRDLSEEKDIRRIGFFKGFRAVYGPTHLIRAIPLVQGEWPNVRFDFVGDGPQLEECQSLAEVLNVNQSIRWIPRQDHARMPALLAQWEVSVMPSVFEAFGVAALESSAMGVPVVASDAGGLRDTVQLGKTGLLVPPDSPRALADGIVELLKNDKRRAEMGQAGRSFVAENFAWSDVARRWECLYEQALDRVHAAV